MDTELHMNGTVNSRESPIDVVIVLGAQNDMNGKLSEMAVERVEGALREYRRRPGSKLVLTGGYGHFNRSRRPHAHYLAQDLTGRGVDERDFLPFVESSTTVEDALFSKRLLDGYAVKSICVVTSELHVRKARLIFEHLFEPAVLTFVGTPNGVAAESLRRYEAHEKTAIKRIKKQGGVIYDGRLYLRKQKGNVEHARPRAEYE